MPTNTPRLGLPKGNGPDNASAYLKGAISGGGLWRALEILDNAILEGSVNELDDVTLTSPNIGADQWTDANHTHASPETAGSTLGPGTTLSTPTLQTPAVSGVMTFGGDATLSRTGPGALRADTHLGVGVNPAAWNSGWRTVQVGVAGSLGGIASFSATVLSNNAYLDSASAWRQMNATAGAQQIELSPTGLKVLTAPDVGAGAAQTFTTRMALAPTGTLTLTPDAGQAALNVGGTAPFTVTVGAVSGQFARLYAAHTLELASGNSHIIPPTDAGYYLGLPANRFFQVYASGGVVTGSSRTVKEGITPLDPQRAMQAVRATPAVTFDYKAPERGPAWYDLPDDPEQAEQVLQQRLTAAPLEAAARHQSGFIAEEADSLFLVGEGQTSPGNSVGILLAALQSLDARVTQLEGAP